MIKTDGSGNLTFSGVGALLTAGSGITISNDTISSTATGMQSSFIIRQRSAEEPVFSATSSQSVSQQ